MKAWQNPVGNSAVRGVLKAAENLSPFWLARACVNGVSMKTRLIATSVFILTLCCGLPCMAEPAPHFLRTLGSFAMNDATNHAVITTSKSDDNKFSVAVVWNSTDGVHVGITKPLTRDGWFVYAENAFQVWVFTGETLSLVHKTDKNISDESSPEIDGICPKAVWDVLPENFRAKHFPPAGVGRKLSPNQRLTEAQAIKIATAALSLASGESYMADFKDGVWEVRTDCEGCQFRSWRVVTIRDSDGEVMEVSHRF
jgi:hypothetical protein